MECGLGQRWCLQRDMLVFPTSVPDRPNTRRGLLGALLTWYDPTGVSMPVAIVAKIIFQAACRKGYDWDAPLPSEIVSRWEAWKESLVGASELTFDRCLLPEPETLDCPDLTFELHHFSDASEEAYVKYR